MSDTLVIDTLSKLFKQKPTIQKGGEEILLFCPSCRHHKKKLNINTRTGFYQCWVGCGFNGKSFYSLLKKVKAPKEYYDILCKNKPNITYVQKESDKLLTLPDGFKPLYESNSEIEYKHALLYCLKRNINVHDIVRYNIGYCTSGEFKNRIITLAQKSEKVIFVSGHEHNLQYILQDNIPQIVSGSGSKTSAAKVINGSQFSYGNLGYAKVNVYKNGSSNVAFYTEIDGKTQLLFKQEIHLPSETKKQYNFSNNFPKTIESSIYSTKEISKKNNSMLAYYFNH